MKADLVLSLVMDKERDCVVPPVPPSFFKQLEKRGGEIGGVYGEDFGVMPGTPGTAVHPLVDLST